MKSAERSVTAIIADDHEIVRQGIRGTLERIAQTDGLQIRVVAEAGNGLEAIREAKAHQPTLLFLDVAMPFANGIEVFIEVRRWAPGTRIIAMTGFTSGSLLKQLVDAGVDGIFLKGGDVSEVIHELPGIIAGQRYVARDVLAAIGASSGGAALTRRELQVLSMIVSGQSNAEVAQALSISTNTVNNHRASIMSKVNVHSMAELMAYALREGLLDAARQL